MSSSTTHPYLPGTERIPDHQQQNQHESHFYRVPQHKRRKKLRFHHDQETSLPVASLYSPHFLNHPAPGVLPEALPLQYNPIGTSQTGFSLSLSPSSNSRRRQVTSGVPGPYGPFTGYAAVLGRSRFLGLAQLLLEEISDVGRLDPAQVMNTTSGDDGSLDLDPSEWDSLSAVDRGLDSTREGSEFHSKKTILVFMMEEVCERYKQYYQQVHAVITSFESVAGLSNAAPFASVALKSMSKHFKCLKSMILNQLRNPNKMNGKETLNREEMLSFGLLSGGGSSASQRGNNMAIFGQPHIWLPHRLPERAVSVLRVWLFEHFLHPYPTGTDKQMLAEQTGLTRNQVSNWFINARVRLWKPMIGELHNLEMCQLRRHSSNDKNPNLSPGGMLQTQQMSECSGSNPSDLVQGQSSHTNPNKSANPSTTSRSIRAVELSQIPNSVQEPINFSYNSLGAAGIGYGAGSSNPSGVALTLGLQQNYRVGLSETITANLVDRFGLEDWHDSCMMGSFEAQGRHFGKEDTRSLEHKIGCHTNLARDPPEGLAV